MINVPIIIISFNNYKYVQNTITQLEKINPSILKDIIIMDNNSSEPNTINYLNTTKYKVVRNSENKGPWIENYKDFYNSLPNKFIITDPDLEFNKIFFIEDIFVNERIRDLIYFKEKNLILLALETSGSIGILKAIN